MREDLNKVICEHERVRSWDKYGNYRNLKKFDDRNQDLHDEDSSKDMIGSGSRESMKYRYGYDRRQFGEHLNPLYGFVRKNVGRKWDDVYSEICQTFDKRSVINHHILIHLFQYVEKNTRIGDDGRVYYLNQYSWISKTSGWEPIEKSGSEYYVHPTTNILTRADRETLRQENERLRKQREAELAKIKRVISDTVELHKIKGVWYEVTFADNAPTKEVREVTPFGGKTHTYFDIRYVTHYKYDVLKNASTTDRRYAASKRQLNHKEIKKHGLV